MPPTPMAAKVWSVRDAYMVEFYLQTAHFDPSSFVFINYTGKRALLLESELPPNVHLFMTRPNLRQVRLAAACCLFMTSCSMLPVCTLSLRGQTCDRSGYLLHVGFYVVDPLST